MLIQMIPFAIIQAYSGTLRETGETIVPMIANAFYNTIWANAKKAGKEEKLKNWSWLNV